MGQPTFWILAISSLHIYVIIKTKNFKNKIFGIFSFGVYIYGVVYFMDLVKKSSVHGNTIHGWYSSKNTFEQLLGYAWIIFFPVLSFFIWVLFINFKEFIKKQI